VLFKIEARITHVPYLVSQSKYSREKLGIIDLNKIASRIKKKSHRKFSHAASPFPLSLDRWSFTKFDKEFARHVPRRIRSSLPFVVEALLVHPRDPYPYEFSYASGRYIFMAEFICWEPRGGQRLITPRRPLLFFLALFVFGDSRYALFIVVSTLEAAAYTYAAFLSVYRVCDI